MKKWLVCLMVLVLVLGAVPALAAEGKLVPSSDPLIVHVGEYRTAKFKLTPARLEKGGAVYETSDESIATVRYNGKVKGESIGECTLTITSKRDPSVSATVQVKVVQPVEKLNVAVPKQTMAAGEQMQIEYSILPQDATMQEVTFTSSKPSVAEVTQEGLITAHARGKTSITVHSADGAVSRKIQLTVQQLPETITMKQAEYTLSVGRQLKLKPVVRPSNTNNLKCTWTSSDESIATVSSNGTIKALATGDVVITATSKAAPSVSGSAVVHCVKPIKSIAFEQEAYDLRLGETLKLVPAFKPADATKTALMFRSDRSRIAAVDANGLVTAAGGGETTITAYSAANEKILDKVVIRVHVPVESVAFEQKAIRLGVGDHVFAPAKVIPQDASVKDMVWTVSDESVAAVSGTTRRPRVQGLRWGRCTLTGTTVDGGCTASITINVGSLQEAVTVESITREDGAVKAVVKNHSDMHITGVTLALEGAQEDAVKLKVDIAPGAASEPMELDVTASGRVNGAVAAWETDTGFYNNSDQMLYSYRIPFGLQVWKNGK